MTDRETKILFWNSAKPDHTSHEWLYSNNAYGRMEEIADATRFKDTTESSCQEKEGHDFTKSQNTRNILILSTTGDPAREQLTISTAIFEELSNYFGAHPYFRTVHENDTFNLSSHLRRGTEGEPHALVLLIRIPRNSQSVTATVHIRLSDLTAVYFLCCRNPDTAQLLYDHSKPNPSLLLSHPLYLLLLIWEERIARYKSWIEELSVQNNEMESVTRMIPDGWQSTGLPPAKAEWLRDFDNLLRQLHATNTELAHCATVMRFAVRFGEFLTEASDEIDKLRDEMGLANHFHHHSKKDLDERIRFNSRRVQVLNDRLHEISNRVRGQINVTFSLVAQRDSRVNIAVAEESQRVAVLTAEDSKVMKTLAFLALVFLPTTLTSAIWSAGVFQFKDEGSNWRVFVGLSVGVTGLVLGAWMAYMRVASTRRRKFKPLHISGVGYVREGRVVRSSSDVGEHNRKA